MTGHRLDLGIDPRGRFGLRPIVGSKRSQWKRPHRPGLVLVMIMGFRVVWWAVLVFCLVLVPFGVLDLFVDLDPEGDPLLPIALGGIAIIGFGLAMMRWIRQFGIFHGPVGILVRGQVLHRVYPWDDIRSITTGPDDRPARLLLTGMPGTYIRLDLANGRSVVTPIGTPGLIYTGSKADLERAAQRLRDARPDPTATDAENPV